MRPQASAAWFLCLVLPFISPSVCEQSQVAKKVAEHDTTANPLFHVGGDVTAPKAIYTPDPEFPEAARKAGFQGICVLSLIVGDRKSVV